MNNLRWFTIFLITFVACAPPVKREEAPVPVVLSREEQEKRSLEAFNKILEILESSPREEVLQKVEEIYLDIINNYPEAPLAQESYSRLIILYTKDYTPPKIDDADRLYTRFLKLYPDSPFRKEIEQTLTRFYYDKKLWDKLLNIQIPYIRDYIKTGELKTPVHLFYYSEAKFGLGDLKEAEKGFRTITVLFPESPEAKLSKKRLEEILKQQGGS